MTEKKYVLIEKKKKSMFWQTINGNKNGSNNNSSYKSDNNKIFISCFHCNKINNDISVGLRDRLFMCSIV